MHKRPALGTGEHGLVDHLGVFFLAQNQPAARPAQGFVRSSGDDVGIRDGAGMQAGRDQAGDVRHVHD